MDGVATSVPQDEIGATPITDVRAIPLEQLTTDDDARRIVSRIMENMEGSSRVRVAMFQSSI
ncbi:MAG: hypothetical protein JOY82_05305 [Streptosporangiaceae bacterium]|nr:hypothetical protein [Streptosporangiaceae bacterium]MBV9853927.1 hypothetical protein [Streptosporangiaceae bacterium]